MQGALLLVGSVLAVVLLPAHAHPWLSTAEDAVATSSPGRKLLQLDAQLNERLLRSRRPRGDFCSMLLFNHTTNDLDNTTFKAEVDPAVLNGTLDAGQIVSLDELPQESVGDLFGDLNGTMVRVNNTWLSQPLPDGQWLVCVNGSSQTFGDIGGDKPSGVTVYLNGTCSWSEFAGGFDGFFSTDAGSGHEDGLAEAVKAMLMDQHALVGECVGNGHPWNANVNWFMQTMIDLAKPVDLDYPKDEAIADGGARLQNMQKVSDACTSMIQVAFCEPDGPEITPTPVPT